jgi:hypothetical protein
VPHERGVALVRTSPGQQAVVHPVGVTSDDRAQYRDLIDRLVQACQGGQGQIGPDRARRGVWNPYANPDLMPDQQRFNEFLAGLSQAQRAVLAEMLSGEFVGGVFQTLVVLHGQEVAPFDDGYEGTPFNDFVGRLDDWPWPADAATTDKPAWRRRVELSNFALESLASLFEAVYTAGWSMLVRVDAERTAGANPARFTVAISGNDDRAIRYDDSDLVSAVRDAIADFDRLQS